MVSAPCGARRWRCSISRRQGSAPSKFMNRPMTSRTITTSAGLEGSQQAAPRNGDVSPGRRKVAQVHANPVTRNSRKKRVEKLFWRKADQLGVLGDSRGVATGERHCTREIVAKASIRQLINCADLSTYSRKLCRVKFKKPITSIFARCF